jgi:hypothetical protein
MDQLTRASEIFDGTTWYYGLEPGSIQVDQDKGVVSFIIHWRQTNKMPARRERITLRLDQVCGLKERLPA